MISKKGFTLVELLAVIVVLGIILVIAIPNILNLINQAKIDAYNSQMELFKDAAGKYLVQYSNEITDKNNVSISLSKLIEKNLIDSNIKNPITNLPYDNINIIIKKNNDVITYGIMENPILVTGIIPVNYDEIARTWKKADISNINNNWYDYSKQQWANAVTVTSTNRATYQAASVGTVIPMADINTMFVWVPRYKYLIPPGTGAREIDVVFEAKYESKSTGNAINTYYTHPAFTFGNNELSGIWVGKFEITGSITDASNASITIKPDLQSVRNQTIKTIYEAVKNTVQNNTVIYGFTNDNDIHIMKNTEWGAVTYLTQSIYGKYGNLSYEGSNKEVYMNNSSNLITGRSMGTVGGSGLLTPTYEYIGNGYYTYDGKCSTIYAGLASPCDTGTVGLALHDKTLAYGASTTGTIYGIYDMSGGTYEYVMGVYKPDILSGIRDCSGYSNSYAPPIACPSTTPYDSFYENLTINNKYYNRYLSAAATTGAIIGDATKEVSNWYGDFNISANTNYPWILRGGHYYSGTGSGMMSFNYSTGIASYFTARIVLAPNN